MNTCMFSNATTDHRSRPDKLPKNFWLTLQQSKLTIEDKLLLIYLYTSPYTNRLGYFRCSHINMAKALNQTTKNIYASLISLQYHNFLRFSESSNFIYLHNYLEEFPIQNKKQGKYIEQIFKRIFIIYLGNNFPLMLDLTRKLIKIDYLSPSFRKGLKELFYSIQAVMLEGGNDE